VAALSAGVALGTLYRYFPSKTHLFVGVMADRVESMREGIARRSAPSGTAADRVFDVLARATRTMLRQPHLGAPRREQAEPTTDLVGATRPADWHGVLQSSLNGRMSASEAEDSLRTACMLLLSPLSSTTPDRESAAEPDGARAQS